MTKREGMPKVSFSQFVLVSTFVLGHFVHAKRVRVLFKCVASVAQGMRSKNDRLTARGSNADQRQLCPGQFRDISHIFSRSRRKLRKLSCRVSCCFPARDFVIDRFTVSQLTRVTRRNSQALA